MELPFIVYSILKQCWSVGYVSLLTLSFINFDIIAVYFLNCIKHISELSFLTDEWMVHVFWKLIFFNHIFISLIWWYSFCFANLVLLELYYSRWNCIIDWNMCACFFIACFFSFYCKYNSNYLGDNFIFVLLFLFEKL